MRVALALASLLALVSPAQGEDAVKFPTPAGWEQVPSTSKLRFAEFRPRGKAGPELVIFRFDGHGEVETVITRWLSRIEQPDGRPTREAAALTRWTRDGMTLHLVDARGTRLPAKDHSREGAPSQRLPGWRLLAGVLVGPGGPYFIRLEATQPQLTDLADGFFALAFGARAAKSGAGSVRARGLMFRPPAGWEVIKPTSRMRAIEFRVPVAGGASLQVVVYHFGRGGGGTKQANLERWIGQFTRPDGSPAHHDAKVTNKTLPNDVRLTVLDLSGTFVAPTAPGSTSTVKRPGQRMLAAIVECPTGPFFLKVVGPAKDVSANEGSIRSFLDALDPIH